MGVRRKEGKRGKKRRWTALSNVEDARRQLPVDVGISGDSDRLSPSGSAPWSLFPCDLHSLLPVRSLRRVYDAEAAADAMGARSSDCWTAPDLLLARVANDFCGRAHLDLRYQADASTPTRTWRSVQQLIQRMLATPDQRVGVPRPLRDGSRDLWFMPIQLKRAISYARRLIMLVA